MAILQIEAIECISFINIKNFKFRVSNRWYILKSQIMIYKWPFFQWHCHFLLLWQILRRSKRLIGRMDGKYESHILVYKLDISIFVIFPFKLIGEKYLLIHLSLSVFLSITWDATNGDFIENSLHINFQVVVISSNPIWVCWETPIINIYGRKSFIFVL